jgi:hypothetical protein
MSMVETNIYSLWGAKQTAKGSPAAEATKKFLQVAGDLNVNRDDGSENWSDGSKFGSSTDWINSIGGAGSPGIEAQSDALAYLLWLFHGAETVTGTTPKVHKTEPGNSFFWSTWWKRVGQTQIQRQKFNDCRIGSLVIEGSTANKAVRVTPNVLSLDAGEIFSSDPAKAISSNPVFIYTEGSGTFTIDSVVMRGHSQFSITFDEGLTPVYGDDVTVYDFARGLAKVTLGVTIYADSDGMAQYNKLVYGEASPAAGKKPIKTQPTYGSYSFNLAKASPLTDAFKFNAEAVKWTPFDAVAPAPDGGPTEISLAGELRLKTGKPLYTCEVTNEDAAYTS